MQFYVYIVLRLAGKIIFDTVVKPHAFILILVFAIIYFVIEGLLKNLDRKADHLFLYCHKSLSAFYYIFIYQEVTFSLVHGFLFLWLIDKINIINLIYNRLCWGVLFKYRKEEKRMKVLGPYKTTKTFICAPIVSKNF